MADFAWQPQTNPETFDDFMGRMLAAFPGAQIEEDNDGQLVIYTNLREVRAGKLEVFDD
jgi:hypothetical protein